MTKINWSSVHNHTHTNGTHFNLPSTFLTGYKQTDGYM